ncbi:hypothetical protein [Streptomyces sp. NPDC052496]|uniref:TolB family protein n=1 Tax=Streptomyces sp. NPDC052496 TaxID=3154951 RepID=UPI003442CE78
MPYAIAGRAAAALVTALATALAAPTAPAAHGPAPDTGTYRIARVSVAPDGTQGDGDSQTPAVSADGRYIAFASDAANLVPGDTDRLQDVYVRDSRTGELTRVDAASAGAPPGSWAHEPALSADGRTVAFTASHRVCDGHGPCGEASYVYARDLRTGRTERVDTGLEPGFGTASYHPAVSADGRYVAFAASRAARYPGSPNRDVRVYVRDRVAGTTERVSGPPPQGATEADSPRISADGRHVAYRTNVPKVSGRPQTDVYVTDRSTGRVRQADVPYDGTPSDRYSVLDDIGADGRYVLFTAVAANLTPGDTNGGRNVFRRDLRTGTTQRVDAADPAGTTAAGRLSADGRYLAFRSADGLSLRDLRDGRTRLVQPATDLRDAALDAHARTVVFASWAEDLVPDDTNGRGDVFVRRSSAYPAGNEA